MSPLYAELNRWRQVPHVWGQSDCILLPADWVQRIRGVDPAADLRLTYGTMGECQRATGFFTYPMGVVAPRMAQAGLPVTAAPVAGDVGLILLPGERLPLPHGALCLGASWALKLMDGAVTAVAAPKILQAWGVGYAHP